MNAGKRSRARSHASFRREAESHAAPHALQAPILDVGRDVAVRREHIDRGCYLLHGLLAAGRMTRQVGLLHSAGVSQATNAWCWSSAVLRVCGPIRIVFPQTAPAIATSSPRAAIALPYTRE